MILSKQFKRLGLLAVGLCLFGCSWQSPSQAEEFPETEELMAKVTSNVKKNGCQSGSENSCQAGLSQLLLSGQSD